jgi:hypothetical protein
MAERRLWMRRSTNLAGVTCLGFLCLAPNAKADMPNSSPSGSETRAATAAKQSNSDNAAPTASHDAGWTSDFSLLEEYRLRIASYALPSTGPLGDAPQTGQARDQHLRLLGDGQISGLNDHFHATMSGALWMDLDGASAPGTASIFATQYDNAQPWLAVYALSAEWQNHKALDHVRVGRQASEHGLPLTFDGASLSVRAVGRRLQWFGFGGKTVHFFESTPGLFENWVASTGAVWRPGNNSAFELDTRLIREPTLNVDRSQRDSITNHSYGLSASVTSGGLLSKIYARGIDQRPSHAGGAFLYQSERLGLGLDGRIHAQLVTLGEVVESENPMYSILGPSLPFVRFRFETWKDFPIGRQAHFGLHLGWRGRQVVGAVERPFNRNTGAIYVHGQVDDFVRKGLFVGGTAEYEYVPYALRGDRMVTLGGSTGYKNALLNAELGTYYQQYKVIYYKSAEELHDTRTVYGSLAFRLAQWLELRGRYEIDIFDQYLESFFLSARQDF